MSLGHAGLFAAAAAAVLVMMLCYLLASPSGISSPRHRSQESGSRWSAALLPPWAQFCGYARPRTTPLHPLSLKIGWGRMFLGTVAVAVILTGMFSAWSFDRRTDQVMSNETLAQIEELKQRAKDNPEDAGGHIRRTLGSDRPSDPDRACHHRWDQQQGHAAR